MSIPAIANRIAVAPLAALLALLAGCADENPVAPPTFSHGGSHTVSGYVLGPDGSIWDLPLHQQSFARVRAFDPATGDLAGQTDLIWPDNGFEIPVAPGTYNLHFTQIPFEGTNVLPVRTLDPVPVVVNGGDVVRDIEVEQGTPLGGSVTIDGAPIPGVELRLAFDGITSQNLAFAVSGADGAWDEGFFDRSPFLLQPGVRYLVSGNCDYLGARMLEGFPTGGFLFPDEVNAINCTAETAPGVAFSHGLTRMVVTPMPADIGGASSEHFDEYGRGWGVQFPVGEEGPSHVESASHLFAGGLLIGVEPDVVLAGIDLGSYGLQCTGPCRDLGLDGELEYEDEGAAGKRVTWSYTDATSAERVGLRIIQRSFDARPPADYVLFQFSIRNIGSSSLTVYPGFFGDWDVDEAFTDDVGFTDLGGRLMYMTSTDPNDRGTFAGTVLLGNAPVSGTLFYIDPIRPQSVAAQMDALRGTVTRQSMDEPGDKRVIHALGPVTLERRQTAEFWIAIVAGENGTELVANAEAAAAHAGEVLEPPDTPEGFSINAIVPVSGAVGSVVTIAGTNLLQTDWPLDLLVGDVEIPDLFIDLVTASQVTFRAPNLGAAGTYDARVRLGAGTLGGTESNVVTWEQLGNAEPGEAVNDDPGTAPQVTFPLDLVGSFLDGDVDDYLAITVPTTFQFTLDWDHAPQDLDLIVLDADLNWGQCNYQGATVAKPETGECSLPAGQYVLWVNDWTTANTGSPPTLVNYRLTVDAF